MLIVLSPAKTLDYESPLPAGLASTQPAFLARSSELIDILRPLTPAQVASLMGLSDKLAALNVARYQDWRPEYAEPAGRQALFAFKGDVYAGLDVARWSLDDVTHAQQHLRMLSGLYGVLRPLDLMLPYRLEMGTELANPAGRSLYAFWGEQLTDALNADLAAQGDDVLINLASQEYFKAVQPKKLAGRLVTPQFRDEKDGQFKIISFFAKKARGRMAAWIIRNRISQPDQLQAYDVDGYRFSPDLSRGDDWVFTRHQGEPCAGALTPEA